MFGHFLKKEELIDWEWRWNEDRLVQKAEEAVLANHKEFLELYQQNQMDLAKADELKVESWNLTEIHMFQKLPRNVREN